MSDLPGSFLLLLVFLVASITSSRISIASQIPTTDIEVFAATDPSINLDRTDFWHVDKAIDGTISTQSFLTPSFNTLEAVVALDLGGGCAVSRLRVNKFQSDTEDNGGLDAMELQIYDILSAGKHDCMFFRILSGPSLEMNQRTNQSR